jgi:hypothetical protein
MFTETFDPRIPEEADASLQNMPHDPRLTPGAMKVPSAESFMGNLENRCAHCGGKFGLVCYHHWGLRFCRKSCKDSFLARTAKDHARIRKWLGRDAKRRSCS